ncbi:MAG TPA: RDD family protein, partial [Thermodesulfobacteriota bacterium]|nr:RDD family protein [Thermodesulfobacteriota bacterium]
ASWSAAELHRLPAADAAAALVLWAAVAALYLVAFVAIEGATPGKILFRLRIVRADGGPVGWATGLRREVIGKLCSALTLGVGYLMVALGAKRGLHDRLAGTRVVRA